MYFIKEPEEKRHARELATRRRHYRRNRKKLRAEARNWYAANKEKARKSNAEYRQKNLERLREYDRIRSATNPIRKERAAKYARARRKSDPKVRLADALRAKLYCSLRGKIKWVSAVRDMGCSVQELKAYLESQFTPEMTWENYGKYWHVDHKAPLSAFNLQCPLQQWVAVQYTNLQPLEASENIRKRDSFDFDSFFRR